MPPQAKSGFFEHLNLCKPCRKEYELETITKMFVTTKCPYTSTPPQIFHAIVSALRGESRSAFSPILWFREQSLATRIIPILVGAMVIAAYFLFPPAPGIDEESDVHTASNDIIFQSLRNFSRLRTGELKTTTAANNPEDVHKFLDDNGFDFAVVKQLDRCASYGAVTSDYQGIQLAHLVYSVDGEVLYVYEVRKKLALEGSLLTVPPAARTALRKTGWYTDPRHPDCNVIVWIVDETLCAAVSSMNKDRMLALLSRD
jgi:hypothetical protein